MHLSCVAEVHVAVWHDDSPILDDAVASVVAKFSPETVTSAPAVVTRL